MDLFATVATWGSHLRAALPALAASLVIVLVGWVAGRLAGIGVCRMIGRASHEEDLARGLGNLTRFAVTLVGVLVASVVAFPSVKPADVLAFLGFGSVAVGFAFKDIFQNFLAGILILFRRPFRLGDQIRSGEIEGTVEDVNLRATIIQTYDGERVIIPNSDVYSRPVLVRTAYGKRRSRFVRRSGRDGHQVRPRPGRHRHALPRATPPGRRGGAGLPGRAWERRPSVMAGAAKCGGSAPSFPRWRHAPGPLRSRGSREGGRRNHARQVIHPT